MNLDYNSTSTIPPFSPKVRQFPPYFESYNENMEKISYFKDEFKDEAEKLLIASEDEYFSFFNIMLVGDGNILQKLGDYGIDRINERGENISLSNYFFLMSCLKGISDEVRSFFMDVMVFCEDGHIEFEDAEEIRSIYKSKIRPLL